MNKTKCLVLAAALVAGCLVVAGCGNKSAQAQGQTFEKASPEIKADWELAVAADKTNDYYTASTAYGRVLAKESNLTPKQLAALESASRDLKQRMLDAANNGDETAKQALVKLMREQNGR